MSTLMAVGNSEGTRRCDATCHEAKDKVCVCICGGRYHGIGGEAAAAQLQSDLRAGVWGEHLQQLALDVGDGVPW